MPLGISFGLRALGDMPIWWSSALTQAEDDLRERFFGDYDLQADTNYGIVWGVDKLEPTERPSGEHFIKYVLFSGSLSSIPAHCNMCQRFS